MASCISLNLLFICLLALNMGMKNRNTRLKRNQIKNPYSIIRHIIFSLSFFNAQALPPTGFVLTFHFHFTMLDCNLFQIGITKLRFTEYFPPQSRKYFVKGGEST